MNAEEMRIKVAEAMGIKRYVRPYDGRVFLCLVAPAGNWTMTDTRPVDKINSDVPDFPNSLDACADMEQTLTDDEIPMYMDELFHVANGTRNFVGFRHKAVMAPAAQRCEAYLKVKDLWTPPAPQEAEKNL